MRKIISDTTLEAIKSLLPLVLAIVILQFTVLRVPLDMFVHFLIGGAMVFVGIVCFLIGVRTGILPLGRDIGAQMPQTGSLPIIIIVIIVFGFVVTVAEPGVAVLASMAEEANASTSTALVFVVAGGMAVLLTGALLRILFGFPTRDLLAVVYVTVIVLAVFTPPEFLSIAFDAGGVAAGPLTVPVFLALGLGFVSVLTRRSALTDGFGLIGIACAGPIIGILLWGVIFF